MVRGGNMHSLGRYLFGRLIWLAIAFFATVAVASAAEQEDRCERHTIGMLMSPDDEWMAIVDNFVCGDGYFVTVVVDTVQLVRRGGVQVIQLSGYAYDIERPNDVFGIDEFHSDDRPILQWLSNRKLQITAPSISHIGLKKDHYEDVEIVVKYDPDDPVARDRFLKSHGLAPK